MARPVKLTSRTIVNICQNILTGATYQACAISAGISYETFNEWRKGGREAAAKDPSKRTEPQNLMLEFSEAVDRANAELEISLMKSIKTRGKRDWKATAWILQNRFPASYSERKEINVNNVEWDREAWKKEVSKRRKQVEALEE